MRKIFDEIARIKAVEVALSAKQGTGLRRGCIYPTD
jgi:hypothetical protein